MPSPTAGLFGGLAQGIFGRMREHEDEQRMMDLEDRKNALTSLGSLLEHATPETRPVIYKQMADVMKLKGKHRGVWDMLTGSGRDDYHNQLSSQLDSVFGNVVGPQKYKELQKQGVAQDMGAAFRANSPYVRSTAPKPTDGKVALRDPIAENLTKLQAQYGLRFDQDMAKIQERDKLVSERERVNDERDAKFKAQDRDHAANIAAQKEVQALATAYALKNRQVNQPNEEEMSQAAEQYALMKGLKVDDLKAAIGLKGAEQKRAEAQAEYYGSGGPGGLGRPMTENQQRTFDAGQRSQAAGTFEKWNKAKAEINRLDTEHQATRQQINQLAAQNGVKYDEANGRFYNAAGQTIDPDELDLPRKQLDILLGKMAKLAADKAAALSEMQGHRATLEGQFPSMYTFGDQWSVTPNPEMGGLAPAGAPRTGAPPEWKVPVTPAPQAGPVSGQGEFHDKAGAKPRRIGEVIDTQGRGSVRVVGIKPGKGMSGGAIYIVESIR